MNAQVKLFTGKVIGEYKVIESCSSFMVEFKDKNFGIFSKETLKQTNAAKPQFACTLVILADDNGSNTYPIKLSEMNGHQKIAAKQIKYAINSIVGGLENTTYDNPEDSDEYKNAMDTLEDHELLMDMVYEGIMTTTYGEGWEHYRPTDEVKFAGKEFLMNYIDYKLKKEGY